ncbi:MAG TPA: tyrosine-protein phosphatase [Aldersonia sp.]
MDAHENAAPEVTAPDKTDDQYWLSGAWNFRDLGGLRTTDGATLASGVLFRSSHLGDLDGEGQQRLEQLGIGAVFDLRGPREIERGGADKLPASVRSVVRPFRRDHGEEDQSRLAPHEAARDQGIRQVTAAAARAFMERAYLEMPTLDGAAAAIIDVARTLTDGEQGVLFHCAAGKDRAGWTAISVLRAVGVTEDDIMADYLRSNAAIVPLRESLVATYGDVFELSDDILGVAEDYYLIAMQTVADRYGDFTGYLDAIGVDAALRARLRDRLLR